MITKANIDSNFNVDLDSLKSEPTESKSVTKASTRGITEKYVKLPKGKHSATALHKVKTKDFAQTSVILYLTPNLANRYIAKGQTSGFKVMLQDVVAYMLGSAVSGPGGVIIGTAVTICNAVNSDHYKQVAKLSTKGKSVKISFVSNRYGRYKFVHQWNGKTVKKRYGTRKENVPMVGVVTTTESTTIAWSSKK